MGGFTSNPFATRVALVCLVLGMLALAYCSRDAEAQEVFAHVQHSSTGGSTEVNAGRNFLQAGVRIPSGFSLAFGRYLIGSQDCANSMSLGYQWGSGWEAWLSTYGDGSCERHGDELDFEGNIGAGVGYTESWRRLEIGFGAGVWQHADEAVHNVPLDQASNQNMQLTAYIVVRGILWRF